MSLPLKITVARQRFKSHEDFLYLSGFLIQLLTKFFISSLLFPNKWQTILKDSLILLPKLHCLKDIPYLTFHY